MKQRCIDEIEKIQEWFKREVTYEGEPYVIDAEQAEAVVTDSLNTIVVARAGSGKTRTMVAKIVYLIARIGVSPEEIITFVFNANASKEINERLSKMRVNGKSVIGSDDSDGDNNSNDDGNKNDDIVKTKSAKTIKIATTFHAFAWKVVRKVDKGRKCGEILAGKKTLFIFEIIKKMVQEEKWRERIKCFYFLEEEENELEEEILVELTEKMEQFVNRAQQQFLAGEKNLQKTIREYLKKKNLGSRERAFIELGAEAFRRYHWYLLNGKMKGFKEFGTDFNLIVSWASKIIASGREDIAKLLQMKKYILIDEYQDFSQLFLSIVMAMREVVVGAKLFVVGDDWQAINRFAGSEVEYFKEFEKYFPEDAKRLEITTNYRCDKVIVNTARKFMMKAMKEKGKFSAFSRKSGKVVLVDPKETECEYSFSKYDRRVTGKDKIYEEIGWKILGKKPKRVVVLYIKTLMALIRKNRKAKEIMILHRNNEMNLGGIKLPDLERGLKWGMQELKLMTAEEFNHKLRIMTMHKSKGLEAEVVIILEADEGVIPKIHGDTELFKVFGETLEVALDDQKRLFYVAMTRAKKRLYIMHERAKNKKNDGFIPYLGRGVERWEDG